ncbi:hypothetical protein ACFV4M_08445 [Kitasatospora indigofera]|uniref:hypothetical protein n=1 Tax=Kitasatospora indigofera TaxID=67307 RepID=UPI00364ACDFC
MVTRALPGAAASTVIGRPIREVPSSRASAAAHCAADGWTLPLTRAGRTIAALRAPGRPPRTLLERSIAHPVNSASEAVSISGTAAARTNSSDLVPNHRALRSDLLPTTTCRSRQVVVVTWQPSAANRSPSASRYVPAASAGDAPFVCCCVMS